MGKTKVVLDTNVLISALGYEGPERILFRKCINGQFQLCTTNALIMEINRVIEYPKLKFSAQQKDTFKLILGENANIFLETFSVDIIKDDPTDNKLLEAVLVAQANYLVTGDKHLLRLKQFGSARILRAPELLKIL